MGNVGKMLGEKNRKVETRTIIILLYCRIILLIILLQTSTDAFVLEIKFFFFLVGK